MQDLTLTMLKKKIGTCSMPMRDKQSMILGIVETIQYKGRREGEERKKWERGEREKEKTAWKRERVRKRQSKRDRDGEKERHKKRGEQER